MVPNCDDPNGRDWLVRPAQLQNAAQQSRSPAADAALGPCGAAACAWRPDVVRPLKRDSP